MIAAAGSEASVGPRGRVLFVTSNGTGLGHLARAMAIARRLPAEIEPVILTLSAAAPVVAAMGLRVEYFPSYRLPASGSDWQWNMRLRHRLEALLSELRPDALVFDGVHPYRALTHVLTASSGPPALWCRRPMWRWDKGKAALGRTGAFARVIEPGELAEAEDRGPTVARREEAIRVAPITFLDSSEMLDREAAERELGLEPGGVNALVALGQGAGLDAAVAAVLERLSRAEGVRVAALESSLSAGLEVPDGVVHVRRTFPAARLYRAFDLAISAAGYNAFHELLAAGVPSVFVPMPRESDDQAARARWAQGAGVGLAVEDPRSPRLVEALGELLDSDRRADIAGQVARIADANGAAAAARAVGDLVRTPPPPRRPNPLRRWLSLSAHPIGPSLPLIAALTARQLRARSELRKPRAVVLALGVERLSGPELAERLRAAFEELSRPPARVLVITDSLEFRALRDLGCGFERIPTAEEVGQRGAEYGRFLGRRLFEIMRRRRPRRAVSLDPAGAELAGALAAPRRRRERLVAAAIR